MTSPMTLSTALSAWTRQTPDAAPTADVIAAVARACVAIADLVAAQPLTTPSTDAAIINASGDAQKPIDVVAETVLVDALRTCDVRAICSEETEGIIDGVADGSVTVALDPIDGSSNIDINGPTGTLFAVLPCDGMSTRESLLQPGSRQLAAGFVLYGPSTVLALTWGDGTDLYALDRSTGQFVRTHHQVQLPAEAREYAINASNARHWRPGVRAYVQDLVDGSIGPRGQDFNMRWLAALVAEAQRILLRGGIFLYPGDARPGYEDGRLRLVYEANPVAFLCEQAGGEATDGVHRILDLQPTDLHQRTPLVFGSRTKVERVRRYLVDPPTTHEESPLFAQRGLFRT